MAALIRELKERIRELEERHRSLPLTVLETELERRPVYSPISGKAFDEFPKIFQGASLKAYVVEDEFAIADLPRISFDSNTFSKIEGVAYSMLGIEEIRDAPRMAHYKPGATTMKGLDLVEGGRVVATLLDSKLYIARSYERAEELAEELIRNVYYVEAKPSFFSILLARLFRFFRRRRVS